MSSVRPISENMDSSDVTLLSSSESSQVPESQDTDNAPNKPSEEIVELRDQVLANLQKPNVPNVNVPERIIICLDVCYDNHNSLYRLGDGTTYTPINMLKRVLDFFLHSKHAINKKTEFALMIIKNNDPCWLHSFTSSVREIINAIDYVGAEESTSVTFDFKKIFQVLEQEIVVPDYTQSQCMVPPPFVVRMVVLYGRSNCIPLIPQDDSYFKFLKEHCYFYIDILLAHEEECALYKCEEIYDALQDLDDGYSYVYEVSRNATKIHDCIAKLLAHPLQRPLQKNTDYTFGPRF